MRSLIEDVFALKTWAVLGATQTQSKFGYKIFKQLKAKGFHVIPINPNYSMIDESYTVSSIKDSEGIEVVNIVVSPEKSLIALDEISDKKIKYVWFQPGSYNDEVIKKAKALHLNSIYGYCVLVELSSY